MERKKLELKPNEKINCELLFDNPIEGESQYGKYFMYGIKNGNEEYNFFSPLKVHEALKDKPKGTKFQITKTAIQKNKKLVQDYEIKFLDKEEIQKENINGYYEAMLQSYDEATKIQNKFSAVNLNQCAVTLFIARTKTGFNNFYKE